MLIKSIFNDAVEQQDVASIPNDVDVAHIISHGQPISIFTDLAFSNLFGNHLHLFGFSNISSPNLKLIYFNACNAGDTINRNHQKIFSTTSQQVLQQLRFRTMGHL